MYLVNNYIDIDLPTLDVSELSTIKKSTICVLLNSESPTDTYTYYSALLKALRNSNKIILVNTTPDNQNRHLLYNLLISHGQYDIYETDQSNVDEEYLQIISQSHCTLEDVENYVDQDKDYYAQVYDLLIELNTAIENKDSELVLSLISEHQNIIAHTVETLQYFQGLLEYYILHSSKEIEQAMPVKTHELDMNQYKGMEIKLADTLKELSELQAKFSTLELSNNAYQQEIVTLKKEKDVISQQLNALEVTNTEHQQEIDMLKAEKSTFSQQVNALETTNNEYKLEIDTLKEENEACSQKLTTLETTNNEYKQEIVTLKAENDEFLQKLNLKGPTIKTYAPIRLSNIKVRARSIIYFKEISYVSYVNTLVKYILETLRYAHFKYKLVIYDNDTEYNVNYTNIPMISGSDYLKKKEQLLYQVDKFVVTEHTPQILEDILKSEIDVVIVYDRLKKERDLIQGRYTKFWVINSRSGIQATQNIQASNAQIPLENIITRPGVLPSTIALSEIADYRDNTESAKLSNWLALSNVNSMSQEPIITTLLQKAGITLRFG